MVYAGQIDDQRVSMGVSGRLEHMAGDRNLIMWDEETNSLWSQIRGEGLSGPNKGKQLDMLPAIFVGLGTWQRMHPDTKVLDLSTVRERSWYYTAEDLAAGTVRANRTRYQLSIGLRHGDEQMAVPFGAIHEQGMVKVEVDGIPLAVVWHQDESAALVYDLRVGGKTLRLTHKDGVLKDMDGEGSWDALTGLALGEGPDLLRFPYLPSYLKIWKDYYPSSRVFGK